MFRKRWRIDDDTISSYIYFELIDYWKTGFFCVCLISFDDYTERPRMRFRIAILFLFLDILLLLLLLQHFFGFVFCTRMMMMINNIINEGDVWLLQNDSLTYRQNDETKLKNILFLFLMKCQKSMKIKDSEIVLILNSFIQSKIDFISFYRHIFVDFIFVFNSFCSLLFIIV